MSRDRVTLCCDSHSFSASRIALGSSTIGPGKGRKGVGGMGGEEGGGEMLRGRRAERGRGWDRGGLKECRVERRVEKDSGMA